MKHYRKPLLAQDSERLVVIDENVKHKTLESIFLKLVALLMLAGLTVFGLSHTATMQRFYDNVDAWFSHLDNQVYTALFCTVMVGVIGAKLTYDKFKRQ